MKYRIIKKSVSVTLVSLILAGVLVFTSAISVMAANDSAYTWAGNEVFLQGEKSGSGESVFGDQSFFSNTVKSVSKNNPCSFMGTLFGFSIRELFKSVFRSELGTAGSTPTEEEIRRNVNTIMEKLDEIAANQNHVMSELSMLSTMVECVELDNALNSYERLCGQSSAPAALYGSLKQEEEEDYSEEEKNERMMSDLLGGMGFGSDYMTYNRTDVAFDNYVFQLGQAIMGPYHVTFKNGDSVSNNSGNLFWIYYEYQRRSVDWEFEADEARAQFNNDVLCTYLLAATLDLESMGARLRAIEEHNANRAKGERIVSDTPVRQLMKQLLNQMDAVSQTADEWIVYPDHDSLYYWVPGHEMRFNKTVEKTTPYGLYHPTTYLYKSAEAFLKEAFSALDNAPDSSEMEQLNSSYQKYKSVHGGYLWEYLNDYIGFNFPELSREDYLQRKALLSRKEARLVPHECGKVVDSYNQTWVYRCCLKTFDEFDGIGTIEVGSGETWGELYSESGPDGTEPTFFLIHKNTEVNHNLTRHAGHAATCSSEGKKTYYTCSSCGRWFSDALGNNEIEKDESKLVIPKPDHWWSFKGFTWEEDEENGGYKSVKANYVCLRDKSHTETVDAKITRTDSGENVTYTAKVSAEDSPDNMEHKESRDVKIIQKLKKVSVPAGKTFTYSGKPQMGIDAGTGYTLSGTTTATNAGFYQAKATLNDGYVWDDETTVVKTIRWKINKKSNPLKIKGRTAIVKREAFKKKGQTLAIEKVIKFTRKGMGQMTFAKISGNKKITISKTTGKVTVKTGLKKGVYKIKIKVKAAGSPNYKASAWKTATFKIKVK